MTGAIEGFDREHVDGLVGRAETRPVATAAPQQVECPCCGVMITMRPGVPLTEVQLLRAAWVEHFGSCEPDWRAGE